MRLCTYWHTERGCEELRVLQVGLLELKIRPGWRVAGAGAGPGPIRYQRRRRESFRNRGFCNIVNDTTESKRSPKQSLLTSLPRSRMTSRRVYVPSDVTVYVTEGLSNFCQIG